MYFRFIDGDAKKKRILKMAQHGTAGFDTATNAETDPPRSSTGPGMESDIYDYLVINFPFTLPVTTSSLN